MISLIRPTKRASIIALVAALSMALASCGGSETTAEPAAAPVDSSSPTASDPNVSLSFQEGDFAVNGEWVAGLDNQATTVTGYQWKSGQTWQKDYDFSVRSILPVANINVLVVDTESAKDDISKVEEGTRFVQIRPDTGEEIGSCTLGKKVRAQAGEGVLIADHDDSLERIELKPSGSCGISWTKTDVSIANSEFSRGLAVVTMGQSRVAKPNTYGGLDLANGKTRWTYVERKDKYGYRLGGDTPIAVFNDVLITDNGWRDLGTGKLISDRSGSTPSVADTFVDRDTGTVIEENTPNSGEILAWTLKAKAPTWRRDADTLTIDIVCQKRIWIDDVVLSEIDGKQIANSDSTDEFDPPLTCLDENTGLWPTGAKQLPPLT